MRKALIAATLLALPLAACKKEAAKTGDAAGEVLPGSASDAMLPEDRVTSRPPLDPGQVRGKQTGAPDDKATGAAKAEEEAPAEDATGAE